MRTFRFKQDVGLKSSVITAAVWERGDLVYTGASAGLANERDAFERVPHVFRAVRLRCNALASVPVYLYSLMGKDKPLDINEFAFHETMPLRDFLWRAEASLLLRNRAYFVRLQNEDGVELGLQWLNPFNVTIQETREGGLIFREQVGKNKFPQRGFWTEEEMIYLHDFELGSRVSAVGLSPALVSITSSKLRFNTTRYLEQFFETGAMPAVLMTTEGDIDDKERERAEQRFGGLLRGVRNAFRVLFLKGKVEVKTISQELKSLEMRTLDDKAIDEIASAFDVPPSILRAQSANYSEKESDYASFLQYTVTPRTVWFKDELNKVLAEYGQRIEFAPNEMPELQGDEEQRAGAFGTYVSAGMPMQVAASILGIDIPNDVLVDWKDVVERKKRMAENAEINLKPKEGEPPEPTNEPLIPPSNGNAKAQFKLDMERWLRKALKRMKEGKTADVTFESDYIPSDVKTGVAMLLKGAQTERSVKMIFTDTVEHYTEFPRLVQPSVKIDQPISVQAPQIHTPVTAHIHIPESLEIDTEAVAAEVAKLTMKMAEQNDVTAERLIMLHGEYVAQTAQLAEAQTSGIVGALTGVKTTLERMMTVVEER